MKNQDTVPNTFLILAQNPRYYRKFSHVSMATHAIDIFEGVMVMVRELLKLNWTRREIMIEKDGLKNLQGKKSISKST